MQIEQDQELASILQEFDGRATAFESWELGSRLGSLAARLHDEGTPKSNVLAAEMVVWHPDVVDWDERAKRMQVEVGQGTIDYWARRCAESPHPLLRTKYADAAWYFGTKAKCGRVKGDILKATIEAVLKAAENDLFAHEIDGYENLEKALELGMQGKNSALVGQVRDELIAYENRHAVDHHPGTWGHCFRLLLLSKERRRPILSDAQAHKLIGDMENRLGRLSGHENVEDLNPQHVQYAALLLAKYHRKKEPRGDDLRRVVRVYADARVRNAETRQMAGCVWVLNTYRRFIEFDLSEDAKDFQGQYQQAVRAMSEQIPSHRIRVPVDEEALDQFAEYMTTGDWCEVFGKFISCFIPQLEHEQGVLQQGWRSTEPLHGSQP